MKITFEISGGLVYIPRLSRPVIIDTAKIDAKVANQLESFVRDCHFFDQPAQVSTVSKGAADYRTYTITVEDGPRVHTVQLTDPITDANLRRLVSRLELLVRASTP